MLTRKTILILILLILAIPVALADGNNSSTNNSSNSTNISMYSQDPYTDISTLYLELAIAAICLLLSTYLIVHMGVSPASIIFMIPPMLISFYASQLYLSGNLVAENMIIRNSTASTLLLLLGVFLLGILALQCVEISRRGKASTRGR